jgi:hypothetical protein
MGKQTIVATGDGKNTEPSKDSNWLKNLLGAVIVGLIVLIGQIFVNPIIARGVKIQESILEQRYAACDKAINILQRRFASAALTGPNAPANYKPSESSPTQLEINVVYTLLSLYCTNSSVASKFTEVVKCENLAIKNIGEFVVLLRKEMGVEGGKLASEKFSYIYYPSRTNKKEPESEEVNSIVPKQ